LGTLLKKPPWVKGNINLTVGPSVCPRKFQLMVATSHSSFPVAAKLGHFVMLRQMIGALAPHTDVNSPVPITYAAVIGSPDLMYQCFKLTL
jgi:hypothetical protein